MKKITFKKGILQFMDLTAHAPKPSKNQLYFSSFSEIVLS